MPTLREARRGRLLNTRRNLGERHMKPSPRIAAGRSLRLFVFLLAFSLPEPVFAAGVNIVAFGASDTLGTGIGKSRGSGVAESDAFPAQIENLLRAKGIDAHVSNQGVPGDTTSGMLNRINSAAPPGTQIVLLEIPGGNDRKQQMSPAETDRNAAQIKSELGARHIKVIYIGATHNELLPPEELNGDHPNKVWHTAMAMKLLPRVLAAARQ